MRRELFCLLFVIFMAVLASCSSPTADTVQGDMIQPGDQIGEMVIRNTVDESETRPLFGELCGWVPLAELAEEQTVECVIAYEPTIFIGQGLTEPDLDKRNEYWENMTWEVSINGQPLDLEAFGTIDMFGGRWWNVLLEKPTSDPLQIVTVLTIHDDPIERLGNTVILTVDAADETELEPEELTSGAKAGQHAYHSEKADLDYLLFVPAHYQANPQQQWPLILYLHGAYSGTNVNMLRENSLPEKLEKESSFPFIVASPLVIGEYEFWAEEETVKAVIDLIEEIEANLNVDPQRIYLTGISAGGNGTWAIGLRYPDRFAALVPAMGYYYPFGMVPQNICDLKDVPIWAFHGKKDETVPLEAEQQLVDSLQACGGDVQFTVYPDAGHDIEALVYENSDLYSWLLSHRIE